MPCWYYSKRDLRNTPSYRDGIDPETEARYRREGARFIVDTGTKMGLRFDTCATGVVYFHRFYMFHSFREFHRYVTAACCLFLAGKVEETPKKCKDLIKITRTMLTDAQIQVFGDDPKEEVMTMERILLQTIKFDLQVEHPYAFLLRFAKLIKGDKVKIQKMVQMAWTFINDSLCTMLCLVWEPEIIAVSLMYLASRLNKFEVTDWQNKVPGHRGKWWESLVEDVTQELLEDVCHQVLDLYSQTPQKAGADSPPPPPPKPPQAAAALTASKQTPSPGPPDPHGRGQHPGGAPAAKHGLEKRTETPPPPAKDAKRMKVHGTVHGSGGGASGGGGSGGAPGGARVGANAATPGSTQHPGSGHQGGGVYSTKANPYMTSQMYSSSFMTQEGSQSIQTLMGGAQTTYDNSYSQPPPPQPQYGTTGGGSTGGAVKPTHHSAPPAQTANTSYQTPAASGAGYHAASAYPAPPVSGNYPGQPPNTAAAPPPAGSGYPQQADASSYAQPPNTGAPSTGNYSQPYGYGAGYPAAQQYAPPPPHHGVNPPPPTAPAGQAVPGQSSYNYQPYAQQAPYGGQHGQPQQYANYQQQHSQYSQNFTATQGSYNRPPPPQPGPGKPSGPGLPTVRITGRRQ